MATSAAVRGKTLLFSLAAMGILSAGPVYAWDDNSVITSISLLDFKRAYHLYTVNKLIDTVPKDGVSFRLNKVDADGNKIDFSDPNHGQVNVYKSTILFSFDAPEKKKMFMRRFGVDLTGSMDVLGQKLKPNGQLTDPLQLSCDLGGTSSSGVAAVTCGKGPTVSPS